MALHAEGPLSERVNRAMAEAALRDPADMIPRPEMSLERSLGIMMHGDDYPFQHPVVQPLEPAAVYVRCDESGGELPELLQMLQERKVAGSLSPGAVGRVAARVGMVLKLGAQDVACGVGLAPDPDRASDCSGRKPNLKLATLLIQPAGLVVPKLGEAAFHLSTPLRYLGEIDYTSSVLGYGGDKRRGYDAVDEVFWRVTMWNSNLDRPHLPLPANEYWEEPLRTQRAAGAKL